MKTVIFIFRGTAKSENKSILGVLVDIAGLLIEHVVSSQIDIENGKKRWLRTVRLYSGYVVQSTKHDKRLRQGVENGFANKSANPSPLKYTLFL